MDKDSENRKDGVHASPLMRLVNNLVHYTLSGNTDLPLHEKLNRKITNSPLSNGICYSSLLEHLPLHVENYLSTIITFFIPL